MALLEAKRLTKVYGQGDAQVHALKGIDLSIARGEFVAIMGASGSGKSTLLAVLGSLEPYTYGDVRIMDRQWGGLSESELAVLRRTAIGFVFQSFNLIPVLTAEENIALPLLLSGRYGKSEEQRVDQLLTLLGIADRRTHYPAELSGGQMQRVAIARALVTQPAIVLADEPTGNLDSRTSTEIMNAFRRSNQELQQTILLVTHDPAVAAWADRVLFLRDGRVAAEHRCEGDPAERSHLVRAWLEEVTAHA